MYNVEHLGQVFTPQNIVSQMLRLKRNDGRTLEPSCGDGAFFNNIPSCVGIEVDSSCCPDKALNMDFFDYPVTEKFDTIIGNPPYVRYQDIYENTKTKLTSSHLTKEVICICFSLKNVLNTLTQAVN